MKRVRESKSLPETHIDWAYDFSCASTLEEMQEVFNRTGPWDWILRESYIAGHYLNTRPTETTHIKLNEYPQAFVTGRHGAGFSILIRTSSPDRGVREQLDGTVMDLLGRIGAEDIRSAEAGD